MPGPFLLTRLVTTLLHPLTPQDVLGLLDPVHSSRQLRGVVTSVTRATPGAARVRPSATTTSSAPWRATRPASSKPCDGRSSASNSTVSTVAPRACSRAASAGGSVSPGR